MVPSAAGRSLSVVTLLDHERVVEIEQQRALHDLIVARSPFCPRRVEEAGICSKSVGSANRSAVRA
jgi:hypothetical protein